MADLHLNAIPSHRRVGKDVLPTAGKEDIGHIAISKVMPSLSKDSVRISFGVPKHFHIARFVCSRFIPEHVQSEVRN